MKRLQISILSLAVTLVAVGQTPMANSDREAAMKTAGIYYAYPAPDEAYTDAPEGYEPFYISHYGRHGSRWITDDYRYTTVLEPFDSMYAAGQLTPLGADVRQRLHRVTDDALGRSGSLSPVGERQHRGIAQRMLKHYPSVFADSAKIDAASSTSVRCVMSMAAFTDELRAFNPSMSINRHAHARDMDYIAHATPEGKAFSADTAEWRLEHRLYSRMMTDPRRLMASLFIDIDSVFSPRMQGQLMTGLYWIASDMQDVEIGEDFYDIFTLGELDSLWRTINARMYLCNADAPLAAGVMKHCADNLLDDIVSKADSSIAGDGNNADLRFGHDTHLLRLLARIGIADAMGQETDMQNFHQVWRDYELSPMAANLQLIFYRNAEGDVIFKPLLNEREVEIPALGPGPYYSWAAAKAYWQQ